MNQITETADTPTTLPSTSLAEDQLKGLYQHSEVAMGVASVYAIALAAYLGTAFDQRLVVSWLAIKLLVVLPRVLLARKLRAGCSWSTQTQMRTTVSLLLVDGLSWGLGGYLFTTANLVEASIVATSLCLVACLSTFGLQTSAAAAAAYAGPILFGTILGFSAHRDAAGMFLCFVLLMAVGLMFRTARMSERRFGEMHRLKRLSQEIADERAVALAVARKQSELKSRLMANVSHEIRSPLHSILALARELGQEGARLESGRATGLIVKSGEHLLRLVNDLLDQSKLESGSLRMQLEPVLLRGVFDELLGLSQHKAHAQGVLLTGLWHLPPELTVQADAERVRQVLDNLIGNAIKFTPHGGTVHLLADLATDGSLSFAVSDSGPGIPPEALTRIFEPFEQITHDAQQLRAGAGLGLSIAKELAQLMGGQLKVYSSVGQGSCFTFSFNPPRVLAQVSEPASTHEDMRAGFLSIQEPCSCALVVDDDPVCAMVSGLCLEKAGWTVEVLSRGELALERMSQLQARPTLVLMDCDMPGIGGLETTRRIRAWERASGATAARVIAVTGRSTPEEHDRCIRSGMDEVLTKPFSMGQLQVVVSQDNSAGGLSAAGTKVAVLASAA